MKFSKRIQAVQPSVTLATEATARELRAKGEDILSFGAGEPDFNTPETVKSAGIEAIRQNDTRYTPIGGTDRLKDAIIQKLERDNHVVYARNEILVSCGAKHSFYNLAQVLWEEGDEVLIPAPYWVSYPEIVKLAGATPVFLPSTEGSDFKISPRQIHEAVSPKSRAIVINSPSNPTGSAYTRGELEGLVEAALEHNLLIVSDEIYEKIVFNGFEPVSVPSLSAEARKNTVLINGVSKSYAMTGWRIGYLAASPEIVAQANKLQGQSTSNPTSVSQAASVEALIGPQDEVVRMNSEFQHRRDVLVEELRKIPGLSCYRPAGSFYSFPNFSAYYGKRWQGKTIAGSLDMADFLLREGKVALVPGIAFGADESLRMSFATSLENIQRGIARIAATLEKLS